MSDPWFESSRRWLLNTAPAISASHSPRVGRELTVKLTVDEALPPEIVAHAVELALRQLTQGLASELRDAVRLGLDIAMRDEAFVRRILEDELRKAFAEYARGVIKGVADD